jgi:uncharacterized PurR-regulated membrane protein YhhQ (DUF165 family)
MTLYFAIAAYAAAMTMANLLVAAFGPAISPVKSFFLIGLDLALRDWLHVRLSQKSMLLLIVSSGLLTFALNPSSGQIAIASATAFTAAAMVDWAVFARMTGRWFKRSAVSNVAGAAVDSVVFPIIAFGAVMPLIMLMQFAAKVVGGALWAWLLSRTVKEGATA